MKVTVGISNRHVHLTKETYEYLFDGKEIEKKFDLNQVGEFASTSKVNLTFNDKTLEGVRVVGPYRDHNQIELLGSDLEFFEMKAPTRRSGDLKDTPRIMISVGEKSVLSDGVIRAERHVHVPTSKEDELGLHERDRVRIDAPNSSFEANVKVSSNGYYELHIDKDEAELYGISSGDEVEITRLEDFDV